MKNKKLDSDLLNVAEYFLSESIRALVGDDGSAEADAEKGEITVNGIDTESEQFRLIVKTFQDMKVKAGGPNDVELPDPVTTTGDLEELRRALESAMFENINTFDNDGLVLSFVKSKKGDYLIATVTGDISPKVTRQCIRAVNYLFKEGLVHA